MSEGVLTTRRGTGQRLWQVTGLLLGPAVLLAIIAVPAHMLAAEAAEVPRDWLNSRRSTGDASVTT
jgi:hypothetical protein